MNRKSCLFARCAAICLIVVQVAATASARTVYDAGKALRENLDSSSPTSVLFTDSKGGKWSYYFSNELGTPNSEVTLKQNGPKAYGSAPTAITSGRMFALLRQSLAGIPHSFRHMIWSGRPLQPIPPA